MIQQQQQQQQRNNLNVRVTPRYPSPIQRPITFQPNHMNRHRPAPRVKLATQTSQSAPTSAATTTHFYSRQNDATELETKTLEAKVEVNSESECGESAALAASAQCVDDSSPAN